MKEEKEEDSTVMNLIILVASIIGLVYGIGLIF